MWCVKRRTVLGAIGGISVQLAGCLSDGRGAMNSSPTANPPSPTASPPPRVAPVETPAPGDCTAEDPPRPTPTGEGLVPLPYPPYPESLTLDAADTFASEYERAYQHNQTLARFAESGTDDISIWSSVPDFARYDTPRGYVVGATGELKTADVNTATPPRTQAPYGTKPFTAWYYLTERFAMRSVDSGGGILEEHENENPSFDEATVIICV